MKTRHRLVLLLVIGFGACSNGNESLEVSGQIEGIDADVGSRVGGRVTEVLVAEGDRVEPGQTLVRLEDDEAKAVLAAAQAKLAQADAVLAKLEAGARAEEIARAEAGAAQARAKFDLALEGARSQEIEAARANADAARAQRDDAKSTFDRAAELVASNAIAQQQYDTAKHTLDAAQSQLDAAEERLNLLLAGTRSQEIAMAKAAYDQAEAALDELRNGARAEDIAAACAARAAAAADVQRAEVNLREMTIVAPMQGVVDVLDALPGDLIKPGPMVRIVDENLLELRVFVSPIVLGQLQVGQIVPITTDAHGNEGFEAKVVQLASQGEFTPRNLQTKEERVQQVFAVKMHLDSAGGKLKPGMTATAHLEAQPGS